MKKTRDFRPVSRFISLTLTLTLTLTFITHLRLKEISEISEMIQDRATVTIQRQQELTCDLSNGAISNDLEWLSEIFNDTKHCAVSQRQLSFLFSSLDNSFANATLTAAPKVTRDRLLPRHDPIDSCVTSYSSVRLPSLWYWWDIDGCLTVSASRIYSETDKHIWTKLCTSSDKLQNVSQSISVNTV